MKRPITRLRRRLLNFMFSVEEFHVERIYDNHVFVTFTRFLRKYPKAVLMLMVDAKWTTAQKLHVCERYKFLANHFSNPVGLHVHLTELDENAIASVHSVFPLPSHGEQFKRISYGLKFLKGIGLETHVFVSGHWLTNDDTLEVCKKLGLTEVHVKEKRLQYTQIPKGLVLKTVRNSMHDFGCY